jgi:hypothetical protein
VQTNKQSKAKQINKNQCRWGEKYNSGKWCFDGKPKMRETVQKHDILVGKVVLMRI